ncbi:hypothetical protein OIU85_000563 [Salix viminalis]|uniref:Uncharacterized protein n=1 Tax=Salix viminalis TaxID=40686 RepID=A0A9Q0VK65_SALVM|nr:hypothetical protein OIU85_000563 [Salix viminalis]
MENGWFEDEGCCVGLLVCEDMDMGAQVKGFGVAQSGGTGFGLGLIKVVEMGVGGCVQNTGCCGGLRWRCGGEWLSELEERCFLFFLVIHDGLGSVCTERGMWSGHSDTVATELVKETGLGLVLLLEVGKRKMAGQE